jgi:hypothetical protein
LPEATVCSVVLKVIAGPQAPVASPPTETPVHCTVTAETGRFGQLPKPEDKEATPSDQVLFLLPLFVHDTIVGELAVTTPRSGSVAENDTDPGVTVTVYTLAMGAWFEAAGTRDAFLATGPAWAAMTAARISQPPIMAIPR